MRMITNSLKHSKISKIMQKYDVKTLNIQNYPKVLKNFKNFTKTP